MSDGRVSVTIYGQNYVVSGGDEERTVRVAAYVDDSMSKIGEVLNASIKALSVRCLPRLQCRQLLLLGR